jgi:hypothetical protein
MLVAGNLLSNAKFRKINLKKFSYDVMMYIVIFDK